MLPKWVASLGRRNGRTPQAEPSQASGKGPRRRDLAKPKRDRRRRAERGHIDSTPPSEPHLRSAGCTTEHDGIYEGAGRVKGVNG